MDIGIFSSPRTVDDLVDDATKAADDGFGSYWTPQIFSLDALTAIAVAARQVEDIRFGTGVVPIQPRHAM
jgi:5,10-methylenetetrahydromethanopterin reductase